MSTDDKLEPEEPSAVQPKSSHGTTHGARSMSVVKATTRAQKVRLLRRLGLRVRDLDGVSTVLLDGWSRAYSKVVLMDRWLEEHGGWVDDDGNSPGF